MAKANNPNRICLVILVGLPATGKSTFTECLKQFLEKQAKFTKYGLMHICYDKLISLPKQKDLALAASDKNKSYVVDNLSKADHEENWKTCRKDIVAMVDKLIFKLNDSTEVDWTKNAIESEGLDLFENMGGKESILIVIDDNSYYQSMRYEYYQLCRKHCAGFCQIYLKPNNIEQVLENNEQRPQEEKVPSDVIEKMNSKIEPPNPFENPWEQFSFTISVKKEVVGTPLDKEMFNIEMCLDVLNLALENPVQPLPPTSPEKTKEARATSRQICSTNIYHRADKMLRYYMNITFWVQGAMLLQFRHR